MRSRSQPSMPKSEPLAGRVYSARQLQMILARDFYAEAKPLAESVSSAQQLLMILSRQPTLLSPQT